MQNQLVPKRTYDVDMTKPKHMEWSFKAKLMTVLAGAGLAVGSWLTVTTLNSTGTPSEPGSRGNPINLNANDQSRTAKTDKLAAMVSADGPEDIVGLFPPLSINPIINLFNGQYVSYEAKNLQEREVRKVVGFCNGIHPGFALQDEDGNVKAGARSWTSVGKVSLRDIQAFPQVPPKQRDSVWDNPCVP